MKKEYWTTFGKGWYERICSRHKTLAAAIKAASACERAGGQEHRIFIIEEIRREKKKLC